jgi:hypothetical protein
MEPLTYHTESFILFSSYQFCVHFIYPLCASTRYFYSQIRKTAVQFLRTVTMQRRITCSAIAALFLCIFLRLAIAQDF